MGGWEIMSMPETDRGARLCLPSRIYPPDRIDSPIHPPIPIALPSQIIPGVSSAFSAPLLAAIPVTHRGVANQVHIHTTHTIRNTTRVWF